MRLLEVYVAGPGLKAVMASLLKEMVEVAKTVADAGIAPTMSDAIVLRQAWAGELGTRMAAPGDDQEDRKQRLDELRRLLGIG